MTASGDNPSSPVKPRHLPTRAEAATLLGMTLTIGSLFLPWERVALPPELANFPAIYKGPSLLSGFQTAGYHWLLTVCGLACGLSLLWAPRGAAWAPLLCTHGLCAMICLMIPLRQFFQSGSSPLAGVVFALIGGGLLLFGALDRFYGPGRPDRTGER